LPVFRKSKEEAKNERKVKALALLFWQFYHRDYGENGTVINGQAMNCCKKYQMPYKHQWILKVEVAFQRSCRKKGVKKEQRKNVFF
jgi:hypothetical protein